MNYIDRIAHEIAEKCGSVIDADNINLYRIYALLALTTGVHTHLEDVHNAWAVWRADTDHKSLIPFDELEPNVQDLDRPYAFAIQEVARWMDGR